MIYLPGAPRNQCKSRSITSRRVAFICDENASCAPACTYRRVLWPKTFTSSRIKNSAVMGCGSEGAVAGSCDKVSQTAEGAATQHTPVGKTGPRKKNRQRGKMV
jgi:hypothetical protein